MKSLDLFSLSTRMFRTNPSRTWLTVLGISVGISAVLFLVSLGYGLQNVILQKIVFNQALLSLAITPSSDLIVLDDASLSEISKIPNVSDVAPLAKFTGQLSLEGVSGAVEMKEVRLADADFFGYSGTAVKFGNLYEENDKNQLIISEAVLKLFGIADPNAVLGKKITVKIFTDNNNQNNAELEMVEVPISYTIKGITDDNQESYAFLPLKEMAQYVKIGHYEQARVKVNNSQDLNLVKEEVIARGYQTQSLSETIEQANKIFRVIQIVLGLFGAVALVVSSIGMFNTMTVTLLERTNEIGIMRALGASKSNLRNLFLAESVIIGFLGGVVGTLIGILLGQIFNFVINSLASKFGGAKTNLFVYPISFLLIIVFLSLFIGFLSGIFPARRAAAMDPLEALRYK
jgi:putative ABC transport system permease protein